MLHERKEVVGVDAVLNRISSVTRLDAVLPVRRSSIQMVSKTIEVGNRQRIEPQIMLEAHPALSRSMMPATRWAHRQIAAKAKIDWRYYERMAMDDEAVGLLAANVNHWWHRPGNDARLARIVMNGEGPKLRAWLSPRYRVLDNEDLVANVLREAEKITDIQIKEAMVDEERMYVRLLTPYVAPIEVGDPVQLGLTLRNSEVGDGAVSIAPFIMRLVCKNGLVAPVQLRQVHLGYKRQEGIVSRKTIELDSQAIWSGIKDWVRFVLDRDRLDEVIGYFQKAKEVEVPTEARLAVGNVVKSYRLQAGEARSIFERYLRNDDDSQFGLVNAVTQAAHETPGPFRRKVQMEEAGGELLTQDSKSFTRMVGRSLSAKQVAKLFGDKA